MSRKLFICILIFWDLFWNYFIESETEKLCDKIGIGKFRDFYYEGRLEVMFIGERWFKMDINEVITMCESIVKGELLLRRGIKGDW